MIKRIEAPQKASGLFESWQETMIWSCLQGVMGALYGKYQDEGRTDKKINIDGDDMEAPRSAMALLGDFCFLAGEPDEELVRYRPEGWKQNFLIMTPQNEAWAAQIEAQYGERARRRMRYAIKKEGDVFDRNKLKAAAGSISPEYTIKMIDEELYRWCREHRWSRDFVGNYESYEQYWKIGLGVVVVKNGVPVAGASSYSSYHGGIEIEIDTKEEFRRQGLAFASGAALILACLERGWYPSWDAQNLWSVALAEKLGYHFDHEYPVYEILG